MIESDEESDDTKKGTDFNFIHFTCFYCVVQEFQLYGRQFREA